MRESTGRTPPATHRSTKIAMGEAVVIDGTPGGIAAAAPSGGGHRREPEKQDG